MLASPVRPDQEMIGMRLTVASLDAETRESDARLTALESLIDLPMTKVRL